MKIKGSWLGFALLAAAFALPLTGCDDDEFDHDPPPGKGTLYVVNKTGDGMDVAGAGPGGSGLIGGAASVGSSTTIP